jgi:acetyl esterase/lipase
MPNSASTLLGYAKPLRREPPVDRWSIVVRRWAPLFLAAVALGVLVMAGGAWFYCHPKYARESDVTFGRRGGRDLVLDVLTPVYANGAGVMVLNSSGWKSGPPRNFRVWLLAPLLRRGYTVFIVGHVSQPEASVRHILEDTQRGVRFIRHHAAHYQIDPHHIGVIGGSSGGHLALLLATSPRPGPSDASNSIDREDSSIQAAAVFFPVTDLLNLGNSIANPGDGGPPISFGPAFPADSAHLEDWQRIGRELSPIYHITSRMPPVLIAHGDADTLVPIDQSLRFAQKARDVGCTVEVSIHHGGTHRGWITMLWDVRDFAGWFDQHLRRKKKDQTKGVTKVTAVVAPRGSKANRTAHRCTREIAPGPDGTGEQPDKA